MPTFADGSARSIPNATPVSACPRLELAKPTPCRLQRRPKAVSEFTLQAAIGLIGRSQPFAEGASFRKQTKPTLGKRTLNVRVLPRHLRSVAT
jgi:hypothetical protein